MSSYIEIITEFSMLVIWYKQVMVGISVGVNQINISFEMGDDQSISILIASMGSDIKVFTIGSVLIVWNE